VGRRLALLIATYQYQDDGLRQLTAPAHDAEALAAVLRNPDIAGFEVTTLINEPHHRVGQAIGDFYRDRRRDDLTLLYFTGHGLKDDDGRLYLAMINTRRDSLLFTSLPAEQIDYAMSGCASRQKVLVLDCCYSGAFPPGRLAKADTQVHALERFQGRGRTVLTASDATQYSFEGDQPQGEAAQSVFTRYLVAGLRDGSADLDGDGDITLDELYSYVHDRVVEEMPRQRPKKQDNVEGRTVIARNINWSLPAHLHHALNSPIALDRLNALDGLDHLHRIGNDTVRGRVIDQIHHLTDDDSMQVATAARARLQSILQHPPKPPPARTATQRTPEPLPQPATPQPQPAASTSAATRHGPDLAPSGGGESPTMPPDNGPPAPDHAAPDPTEKPQPPEASSGRIDTIATDTPPRQARSRLTRRRTMVAALIAVILLAATGSVLIFYRSKGNDSPAVSPPVSLPTSPSLSPSPSSLSPSLPPSLEHAQTLFAAAQKFDQDGKVKEAQAKIVEAVQLYDELIKLNPDQNAPALAPAIIQALGRAGVDFSVTEAEFRTWLANPDFTPYPALSQVLDVEAA
jgi:hypothetical protein